MLHRHALAMLALLALAAGPLRAETVTVFAAASLGDALAAVAEPWETETGHEVVVSAAASSAVARQIAAGAPADIVISANPQWMDWLEGEGRIEPGTRRDLLANRLVLIGGAGAEPVAEGAPLAPQILDRLGMGRLAVALTEAVPAGIYARAALEAMGAWDALRPRLAEADNVRAALALVATGAAPLGIVYATDAKAEPRVAVLLVFAEETHPPIRYPAARVAGRGGAAADAFLAYLGTSEARAIFERAGFAPLPG